MSKVAMLPQPDDPVGVTIAPNLTTKLAEVMAAVGRIAKRGRNDFHNYDYVTEADIVETVRKELAARKLVIVPEVRDYEIRELAPATDKKSARFLTLLRLRFLIRDGDSGEQIEREWIGAGEDSGDKGVYKAMTGGDKYFLLKLLLIPTGDDPERTSAGPPNRGRRFDRAPKATTTVATTHGTVEPDTGELHEEGGASGVLIVGVREIEKGTNKNGPWTLFGVNGSDGVEYVTFDPEMADRCSECHLERRPVQIKAEKKPGKSRPLIKGLTELHKTGEEQIL